MAARALCSAVGLGYPGYARGCHVDFCYGCYAVVKLERDVIMTTVEKITEAFDEYKDIIDGLKTSFEADGPHNETSEEIVSRISKVGDIKSMNDEQSVNVIVQLIFDAGFYTGLSCKKGRK
jgi:hypothetical protein